MSDPRMNRCVACLVQLQCSSLTSWSLKFRNVTWTANLILSWWWMTNPPFLYSGPWAIETFAPQSSQCVEVWEDTMPFRIPCQRGNFHWRRLQPLLGFWKYCVWLLMVWHWDLWYAWPPFHAGYLFGCSDCCFCCCHGLDMPRCLKDRLIIQCFSKVGSLFSALMRWLQTSLLAWWFGLGIDCVW